MVEAVGRKISRRLVPRGCGRRRDRSADGLSQTAPGLRPFVFVAVGLPTVYLATTYWVAVFLAVQVLFLTSAGAQSPPLDFDTEVLPILSKSGCNAAECHGAAGGQNGFQLSLFAGNPAADHRSIAIDHKSRRVISSDPAESLLLLKPTGGLEHRGGIVFDPDSESARILRTWIAQGARRQGQIRLSSIEVSVLPANTASDPGPLAANLNGLKSPPQIPESPLYPGQQLSVRVIARFEQTEGEPRVFEREVTAWSQLQSQDESALLLTDRLGGLKIARSGSHFLMARFLSRVALCRLDVPYSAKTASSISARLEEREPIDRAIDSIWQKLNRQPPPIASEPMLVRRASLALTGRLPTFETIAEFLADSSEDRFERYVDTLLSSEHFASYWAERFADGWQVPARNRSPAETRLVDWLRDQISQDRPLAEIAREVITARGGSEQHAGAAFYLGQNDARRHAEKFARVWLGVRLRCAECHNHPLDHWTQDDYYGLAAAFARLEYSPSIQLRPHGSLRHPGNGKPSRLEFSNIVFSHPDPRVDLANWLLQEPSGYFDRAWVNRIWAVVMGQGLFEPLDDFRTTNPVASQEVLDALIGEFHRGQRRLRPLLRAMVKSAAWRRAPVMWQDESPEPALISFRVHRLSDRVLQNCVSQLLGTATPSPPGGSATPGRNVSTPETVTLPNLCSREDGCDDVVRDLALTTETALALMNGNGLNELLRSPENVVNRSLAEQVSAADLIRKLYREGYSREPADGELDFWIRALAMPGRGETAFEVWQDFLWSLLLSEEFLTNH